MPRAAQAPLDCLDTWLPDEVRRVVERQTPIPTIAAEAAAAAADHPELVRGDIGQIVGLDAAAEVLYGPPVGLPALRASLAETWTRAFDLGGGVLPGLPDGLTAAHVTVTTGAAEGLSLLLRCFASERVVALPREHWENYRNGVDLARGRVEIVDMFDADGHLDADGLARGLAERDVSVLVANFPCNPTGAVLDAEETARLAAVARDVGVLVIADEVYARLRYDGGAPQTLLRHAPGHVAVVSSASKEYLLPGARVGYVISARRDLTDRVLRKLVRANTASPNVLGQRRLLDVLDADLEDLRHGRPPSVLSRIRDAMAERRDALLAVLDRHGLSAVGRAGHRPEGTIFLMATLPEGEESDADFCQRALQAGCVSAIPGSAFGMPGTFRLSYGAMTLTDIARLDQSLQTLLG